MATSQDRVTGTPTTPPELGEIGMIELLECDSRPTFILDLEQTQDPYHQRLHTVFFNASLQRLPHVLDPAQLRRGIPADDIELGQYSRFKQWAISSPTYGYISDGHRVPFEYQSLSWIGSTLRKRWRIISGSAVGLKDNFAGSFMSPPAGLQMGNGDMVTTSIDPLERKKNGKLQASIRPRWVDDLPTSEHVQFFKSTDWSATALGPLETWSGCLRQMTRFLMSDSRAACMFWYKPSTN